MPELGTLFADDLLGGYLIERFLGIGPVFETYSAFHPQLEVHRLLHVVRPDVYGGAPAFRDEFLKTIRTIVRLRPPNMIPIGDVGWDEPRDILYYVTDQVAAPTLEERIKNGPPFSEAEAMPVVSAVTEVLRMLAKNDLLHLRIAPENMFLEKTRGLLLAEPGLRLRGLPMARSAFAAPESAENGGAAVDARSDIYSLGAVWFLMLTGKMPPSGAADPRSCVSGIRHDTAALVRSMLDPCPDKRPASPDALADALARLPEGMTFDNPDLMRMAEQEIARTVSDRTQLLSEKLQARRLLEVKIWKYAAIALGAIAALLLIRCLWGSVDLALKNSRLAEQTGLAKKAETEAEDGGRSLDALRQSIRSERMAIENAEREIATLKRIFPSEKGK